MKLKRREKILLGVVAGLVGLVGLWFLLLAGDSRSVDQLITERDKLKGEIENKKNYLAAAGRDAQRLAQWQRRALPPDPVLARSLYQNWLRSLVARANLRGSTLVANDAGARRDQFTKISFNLHAQAKLGDLVQFMYEFYSAGFLHQIRDMTLKPVQSSHELDMKVTIEALSLPTAVSKDRLPEEAGHGLQLAKVSDYRDPIVARDFFATYVPARGIVDRTPRRPPVDPANFAFVTGFTEVDGAAKVWIKDRMGEKPWQLGVGEGFKVGTVQGTVHSIRPEGEVVVDFDGKRRLLRMGDNLHGGVEIQDGRPKQPGEGVNSAAPGVGSKQPSPDSDTIDDEDDGPGI